MSLYKPNGSSFWWASLYHNGERVRQSTGTEDRKEAQRIHDELKARLWKVEPKIKGFTWGKAVDLWCEAVERSDSELLSLQKFAKEYADRRITAVTAESLETVLKKITTTDGTYTRYRTMLMAILNLAKAKGFLGEVPKIAAKKQRKAKTREWITHEQWERLRAELPAHMKPMATFAITTGLRQANVLGLTWDRVDLERRHVWVEGEDPKGGRAIAVPLGDEAVELLKTLKLGLPDHTHAHVFTYRGKPVKEIKTAWIAACIRAGLGRYEKKPDGRTGYAGFTWHGLRHTWATWHMQNGTPIEVLQKLGAWADLRMVMLYSHHSPGYLSGFANNAALQHKARPSLPRPKDEDV
jgi:integrase